MSIVCNEHVICTFESSVTVNGITLNRYRFTADDGYALWKDNEEGNLDENGEPYCYWYGITSGHPEEDAHHIWAKLIDETMEIFGDTEPEQPVMKARMMKMSLSSEPDEESHTYIDENGVEREKRGIY